MKQLFLVSVLLFLLTITAGYSFTVENEQGKQVSYFSEESSLVTIVSESNDSIQVIFQGNNLTQYSDSLELFSCRENSFCREFDVMNYTNNSNSFTLSRDNITKELYLDNEVPKFSYESTFINESQKEITLFYNASDNSGELLFLRLFKMVDNNYEFIANITNTTNYTLPVSSSQELEFLFKAEDVAGNSFETTKIVTINDFLSPELDDWTIVLLADGTYKLEFETSDEALDEYAISQNTLFLKENITGESFSTSVPIPFRKGIITLRIDDEKENSLYKNLSLSSPVSISSFKKYTNSDEYSFSSNAQYCQATKLNGDALNKNFSKSGNTFSRDFSFNENQKNFITFFCEKNSFREYFSNSVVIDTQSPEDTTLEVNKREDGSLELEWEKSNDNMGEVEYRIEKNGDVVERTSQTSFTDKDVEFPNEYSYEIIPVDRAGNEANSNTIEKIPTKVSVELLLENYQRETTTQNMTTIALNTEKNVSLNVQVESNGKTTYTKELTTSTTNPVLNIPLIEGPNSITFRVEDSYSNTNEVVKQVVYEETKKPGKELKQSQNESIGSIEEQNESLNSGEALSALEENQSSLVGSSKENSGGGLWWLWLLLFLAVFALFVWIFVYNEDTLKKNIARKHRKQAVNERKRKEDDILGKSLQKVRQKRIQKQKESEEKRKQEQEKQSRPLSSYQKAKHSDITGSSRGSLSFDMNKKKQHPPKKRNTSSFSLGTLFAKKEKPEKPTRKEHISKEKNKEDSFSSQHLNNLQGDKGWNSTNSYKSSDKNEAQEEEIPEETQKKEEPKEEKKTEKVQKPSKKSLLFSRTFSRKKPSEEEKDDFTKYLEQNHSSKGWDSTRTYRQSYVEQKEREKQEAEEKRREEEEQKRYEQELESQKSQQKQDQEEKSQKKSNQSEKKRGFPFFSKKKQVKENKDKLSLDDYLNKKTKKKRYYFAEKEVERELKR